MNQMMATPLSRKKIREWVMILRKVAGNSPYFDVIRFIEHKLPIMDPELEFNIIPDKDLPGAYAKAFPYAHRIDVRESVYEAAVVGVGRDRFTLCHELGHYILHGPKNISYPRAARTLKAYENPEWQANTFAGEILAPTTMIVGMEIDEITKIFGVSGMVAAIQKKYVAPRQKNKATKRLQSLATIARID